MIDQLLTPLHHLSIQLQLMTIGQREVTVDTHWVCLSISLRQAALHCALCADRNGTDPAVMPLSEHIELLWTSLADIFLVKLTLVHYSKLHRQIVKVFALFWILRGLHQALDVDFLRQLITCLPKGKVTRN